MAGKIKLQWKSYNTDVEGFRIYRSIDPIDVESLPAPLATVGPTTREYIDDTVLFKVNYYYRIESFKEGLSKISDNYKTFAWAPPDSPGPMEFVGGDGNDGFFGEVPASELFTGDELASLVGLTSGVSQNSSEPWLKFAIDGQIVYIAKKPLRHSVSWDDLYAAGLVYGTDDTGLHPTGTPTNQLKIVSKGGFDFKVRLLTGAHADPMTRDPAVANSNSGEGSEWNRLMYRVHQSIPTGVEAYDGGPQIGPNWASYADADLVVGSGNGRTSWTQEAVASIPTNRVCRGFSRVSNLSPAPSSYSGTAYGWRPLLQLVG